MPTLQLTILTGQRTGDTVDPERDIVLVGSAAHCDVRVTGDEISPEHCRISVGPASVRVEDLESDHGTFLSRGEAVLDVGGPLGAVTLKSGDQLRLGVSGATLAVDIREDEEPANVVSVLPIDSLTGHTSSGERNTELLAALAKVHGLLGRTHDPDQTLSVILDAALTLVPRATHATIVLSDPDASGSADAKEPVYVPVLTRVRGADGHAAASPEPVPVTRSVFRKVVRERAAVLAADAPSEAFSSESLLGANIKSTIGVPLWRDDAILGVLQLDNRDRPALFDTLDLEVLGILTTNATLALDNARLIQRLIRAERQLKHENQYLKNQTQQSATEIVGQSSALQSLMGQVKKVAATRVTVLIQGETGTGKELIAAALHAHSGRSQKLFVAQNCAAVPKDLLESELFGHRRGAFTGATEDKRGLFELADGGTLFLDEVSELPLALQAKLLRALQEREIRPLGATREKRVDVRVVAACNRNLEAEVRAGNFREDLFYRLNVFPLSVPPLRERRPDIALIAKHFLKRYALEYGSSVLGFSQETLDRLTRYDWPGNVRELENEVQRLVIQADPETYISVELLSDRVRGSGTVDAHVRPPVTLNGTLKQAMDDFEREVVLAALASHSNNKTKAAKSLGITREGLHKKLKQLGIG
jgi:Nif-specific regulatory protein